MHFFGVAQVNATDGQCCAAFDRYRVLIGRTTPRASSESYSVARTPRNVNFRTKFIVYAAAAAWLSKGGNTKRQTAAMANLRAVAIKRQIAANKLSKPADIAAPSFARRRLWLWLVWEMFWFCRTNSRCLLSDDGKSGGDFGQ